MRTKESRASLCDSGAQLQPRSQGPFISGPSQRGGMVSLVVRELINANQGLKVNQRFYFSC